MDDLELSGFLRRRRAAVRPHAADVAPRRRVPGLRREEVADRAGVSRDYLVRLEQGRERRPSPMTLDALARALELTEQQRRHLHALVRPPHEHVGTGPERVHPNVADLLRQLDGTPALLLGRDADVLAITTSAADVVGPLRGHSLARRLVAHAPTVARLADPAVLHLELAAWLRAAIARRACDPRLCALADTLRTDAGFAAAWDAGGVDVAPRGTLALDGVAYAYELLGVAAQQTLVVLRPFSDRRSAACGRRTPAAPPRGRPA